MSGSRYTGTACAALLAIGVFAAQNAASAAYLYWTATAVQTGSVSTCFSFAQGAMTQSGVQNVRRSESEVTGSSGGTYVAVTCIGTMPRATAVIMAVGEH
jgi:hypothetical protein